MVVIISTEKQIAAGFITFFILVSNRRLSHFSIGCINSCLWHVWRRWIICRISGILRHSFGFLTKHLTIKGFMGTRLIWNCWRKKNFKWEDVKTRVAYVMRVYTHIDKLNCQNLLSCLRRPTNRGQLLPRADASVWVESQWTVSACSSFYSFGKLHFTVLCSREFGEWIIKFE